MEYVVVGLLIAICFLSVFNVVLLIAIAAAVAKMLRYGENQSVVDRTEGGLVDLPARQPTYADLLLSNFDGVGPRPPNSDGAGGVFDRP